MCSWLMKGDEHPAYVSERVWRAVLGSSEKLYNVHTLWCWSLCLNVSD